jgi:hypothetical protein
VKRAEAVAVEERCRAGANPRASAELRRIFEHVFVFSLVHEFLAVLERAEITAVW